MKKQILIFLMSSFMLISGCSNNNKMQSSVDMSVRQIAGTTQGIKPMLEEISSAVVGISVEGDNAYSIGSGVAISAGGYIVTNFHVVADGNEIMLYFADKTTGSASVIWADPSVDIAVLKSSREIPYLSTKDMKEIFVGEDVYAVGTPLTLQFKNTVTKGIVSAVDRVLETQSNYGSSYLQNLIQHDASINPGNSGGPIIDRNGRVIGINTLKANNGEGIGFAIPIEIAKVVVDKLSTNNAYTSAYLGVFGFDSDIASVHGDNIPTGVFVVSTTGNAEKHGIKKGDVIIEADGIEIKDLMDLRIAVYKKNIGDDINIKFLREDKLNEVNIKLTKRV